MSESGPTQLPCADPNCVICQWTGDAMIRFFDRMKAAILADAPPPITVRRGLPGTRQPQEDT